MFGPTPASGWSLIISAPVCSIATRSRLLGSRKSNTDMMRSVIRSGASANSSAMITGITPVRRKSLRMNRRLARRADATHAARERECEGDDEAGMTSAGQSRSRAEDDARRGDADHQHQRAEYVM